MQSANEKAVLIYILGDLLRLGYVFKTRPGSQHCLVPSTCLTQKEQEDCQGKMILYLPF